MYIPTPEHRSKISQSRKTFDDMTELQIIREYNSGKSTTDIGKNYNVPWGIIHSVLKRHNIMCRNRMKMKTRNKINFDYFKNIDDENKAYILGFLYADGGNVGPAIYLTLQERDLEILKKIHKLLEMNNKICKITKTWKNDYYLKDRDKIYIYYRLSIGHQDVVKDLERFGVVRKKTQKIRFPVFLSNDLKRHFLRGYFDGDGCLTINKSRNKAKLDFTSNRLFCEDISIFIEEQTGNKMQVIDVKNKKISRTICCGNKKILNILDWLYKDANIFLNRKFEKYQQLKINPISNKIFFK